MRSGILGEKALLRNAYRHYSLFAVFYSLKLYPLLAKTRKRFFKRRIPTLFMLHSSLFTKSAPSHFLRGALC